ncbi:Ribosomal protein L7/L12 [Plasmodium coatneyi]|uniref:Ribosomal protein L7/L12 n=1 Tax=Plasmodium coatneyi TaxID=208452 RepID=A0A1B1DVI3_9APIC|nr:Ribosomal protein L7/L12 [Plasmodium coatneyi]ANQ06649.1 Ribosomal protein L7/L12 [Plasmodium coatneyi]
MKKNALVKNVLYSARLRQNGAHATNAAISAGALSGVDLWTSKTLQTRRMMGNAPNSSFNLFDKIKDISRSNESEEGTEESDSKKRKPSKKVLKLVDEILNLTLIEAADLCDLCQEKLDGEKQFNNSVFLNRNPFPHPAGFFAAGGFSVPNLSPGMNSPFPNPVTAVPPGGTPNLGTAEKNEQAGTKKEEKKNSKSTFNVKLENFDAKNKINTIKEIRKITNVGLKEAKDMVESAPFYVQKNVPAEKAEEMKKKFEELGATIILE